MGLSKESDPLKIEQDLLKLLPESYLEDENHLFIYHGRKICTARQANCKDCVLSSLCEKNLSNQKK